MASLGYTWYPKDFISDPDVMFMTAAERGVYRDLIDLAYTNENRIPYSIDMLAKYTNSDVGTVEKILSMKGEKVGEFWAIPSCGKRLDLIHKNRSNGAKGGAPKGNNNAKKTTQKQPKNNRGVVNENNPKTRQIEIESKIEIENKNKDVVVEETTTLSTTTTPRFGVCSDHDELKSHLKSLDSWKQMFGKQSGISSPADTDQWIDRFVDFAIANGKGEVILKVSEAQSYCLHWVTKRIAAGETAGGRSKNGSVVGDDHSVRFTEDGRIIPRGAVRHG